MATIADLEALIGPPTTESPRVDWARLEELLGIRFPDSYKRLFDQYSDLEFDGFLGVFHPGPPEEQKLAGWIEGVEHLRVLTADSTIDLLNSAGEVVEVEPFPLYPEPGGLFRWGNTQNGDDCLWFPDDPDPNSWSVVVTDGGEWWHFPGNFVDFLVGIMNRTVRCPIFPEGFPDSPRAYDVPYRRAP